MQNSMTISPVGAVLFHGKTQRQTDNYEANSRFLQFYDGALRARCMQFLYSITPNVIYFLAVG